MERTRYLLYILLYHDSGDEKIKYRDFDNTVHFVLLNKSRKCRFKINVASWHELYWGFNQTACHSDGKSSTRINILPE